MAMLNNQRVIVCEKRNANPRFINCGWSGDCLFNSQYFSQMAPPNQAAWGLGGSWMGGLHDSLFWDHCSHNKKILGNLEIAQKIRTSDVQPWLNFSKWVAWGMAVFTASNPIPPEKYPLTTPYLVLEHIGTVFGGSCGDIRKKIPWQLAMPDPWPRQPPRPLLWWRAIAAAAKRFGVVREDPQFGNPTYRTY